MDLDDRAEALALRTDQRAGRVEWRDACPHRALGEVASLLRHDRLSPGRRSAEGRYRDGDSEPSHVTTLTGGDASTQPRLRDH